MVMGRGLHRFALLLNKEREKNRAISDLWVHDKQVWAQPCNGASFLTWEINYGAKTAKIVKK